LIRFFKPWVQGYWDFLNLGCGGGVEKHWLGGVEKHRVERRGPLGLLL
jgi:hypothetical protein